jgi:hypothetical protein
MAGSGRGRAWWALGLLLLGAPWAPGTGMHTMHAHAHGAPESDCAVLGVYRVGPTIPPPIARPPAGSGQGTITPDAAIAYPISVAGTLTGTVTLTASTACGTPTQGSFSVALRPYRGPLPMVPESGSSSTGDKMSGAANSVIVGPMLGGTTVLTATGTFSQDSDHAADRSYVLVDATVTYGRVSFGCPPLCGAQPKSPGVVCMPNGCRTGETVTRVSTFHDVTGYLALNPGKPATIALAFLPPPDLKAANSATAISTLQPIALWGRWSGAVSRTG